MDDRVRFMMERENVSSREEALKMVKQVDAERKKWSLKLYGIDTWESRLYDLVIKIEKITIDDAVDLICNTIKLKPFQTTPDSQKQIDRLAREARKRLEEGTWTAPFFEPLRESPWSKQG